MVLLFACGVVVVLAGELFLLARFQAGILTSFIVTRNVKVLMIMWLQVLIVAVACEVANFFFPFWVWLPHTEYSRLVVELIITFLGYTALFHPMIVMLQVLEGKKK